MTALKNAYVSNNQASELPLDQSFKALNNTIISS